MRLRRRPGGPGRGCQRLLLLVYRSDGGICEYVGDYGEWGGGLKRGMLKRFEEQIRANRTIDIIPSDPKFTEEHVRRTTAPFKPLCDQG